MFPSLIASSAVVTSSLVKSCATPGSLGLLLLPEFVICRTLVISWAFLHQIDAFQIEAVSLGNLQKVLLHCEARDKSHYWYCEKVIVKEPGSASESIFTCER